jgi:hypothetical protein
MPARALEGAPPAGRHADGNQNMLASTEDTEPGSARAGIPGEPAGAGARDPGLPSYDAAPPAPAPPAPAPPAPPAPPGPAGGASPWVPAEAPPPAGADPQSWADVQAESRAWTGMESPAWNDPQQPGADAPAWGETGGPALPRRVRQASLVPQLRNAPPAYPPLPGRFPDPRPPDDARATVSAIQHGFERGRAMFAPDPGQHAQSSTAGAPGSGEPDAGHDEPGGYGAYQDGTSTDDWGPHGPD